MKKIFFFGFLAIIFSSCVTFKTQLLTPSNNHLNPKLPNLEVTQNGAGYSSEMEFNTEEKLYTIFKNEVRECIISAPSENSLGFIRPIIKSTTEQGGFGVAYLTGFTLGTLNLLGMPYGNFTTSINAQILILDKNEKVVWVKSYSTSKTIWAGFYYNSLKQPCIDNYSLEIFRKNILNEFRNDITYDYNNIISKLNK